MSLFLMPCNRVREETDGDVWMLFEGSQPPQNWTDDVKFAGPAHLKPRAGIPFEVAFRFVHSVHTWTYICTLVVCY